MNLETLFEAKNKSINTAPWGLTSGPMLAPSLHEMMKSFPDLRTKLDKFWAVKQHNPLSSPYGKHDRPMTGPFVGLWHCHLQDDAILIYCLRNHCVHLVTILPHAELEGKRIKNTVTRLKNAHELGLNESAILVQSPQFKAWFGNSKVVDSNGNPLPVYHGTGRPDRVGNQFKRSRATAGPMAYFSDNPDVSSGYAMGKADTSISDEDQAYARWFKSKVGRYIVPFDRLWGYLSSEERNKVVALAPRVTRNDDDEIVLGDETLDSGLGAFQQHLKQSRGNYLLALVEEWLTSGSLFNYEEEFLQVLKIIGLKNVYLDHPNASYPMVYKVYLSIQNPLYSNNIPKAVVDALVKFGNRQRSSGNDNGYQWNKNNVNARDWLASLTGDSSAWTVIPDWVTKTLTTLGYDGVCDPHSNGEHQVWIPFRETQVKSAISNKNFDPNKKSIHEVVSVAPIADNPNPSLGRCTTVSCNAILAKFNKPLIKSASEMPRTSHDSLDLLQRRGLKFEPTTFSPPMTVKMFAQMNQRGCFYLGTQGHAIAIVDGVVTDTERKGLDGRMVQVAARIFL